MNKKLKNYSALAIGMAAVLPTACKKEKDNDSTIDERTLNKTIGFSTTVGFVEDSIDVNLDGVFDLVFGVGKDSYEGVSSSYFYMASANNNKNDILSEIIEIPDEGFYPFVKTLSSGTTVAPESNVWVDFGYCAYFASGSYGFNLGNVKAGSGDKYIGFRFADKSNAIHYGWALINYASDAKSVVVKELAYKKDSNVAINVGDK